MKYLSHCQPTPEAIEAARVELQGDIELAERRF
jgi:NADH:ubiquinone oxidoreductase subunit B-like Fe-S oxidoreductase